jgi:serine-protein kinase ATM
VIRDNDHGAEFSRLKDKDWRNILNALFGGVTSNTVTYQKSRGPPKAASRTKLLEYSSALRTITEVCSNKLRYKTVKALVDHIHKILSTDNDLEPLRADYIRSLSNILEYQPHVEHLQNDWHALLTFCLESLSNHFIKESESDGRLTSGTSTFFTTSSDRHKRSAETTAEIEALLTCIKHLCRPPSSPVQFKAVDLTSILVAYFQTTQDKAKQSVAMQILNSLIERLAYENLEWTRMTVKAMVPILVDLWALRTASLCDEILVFLTHAHLHIASLLKDSTTVKESAQQLLETMKDDYASRDVREQLQFEAVLLDKHSPEFPCLVNPKAFQLCQGQVLFESSWATVFFISYLSAQLDANQSAEADANARDARKRRKVSTHLSNTLQSIASGSSSAQITTLQILSFTITLRPLSTDRIGDIMDKLIPLISGMATTSLSWALLSLSQCALHAKSHSPNLSPKWLQVWELTTRLVPSPDSSRAACHLLDTLLKHKHVLYPIVSQSLDNMLEMSELSGPAVLSDSSTSLWMTYLSMRLTENPTSSKGIAEKLLRWLFKKWTPSMYQMCRIR